MLSPRSPLTRPDLRRTQSVHQMSSYALNIGTEGGSDGEDSISDISMDTCFRFDSGSDDQARTNTTANNPEEQDEDVQEDEEDHDNHNYNMWTDDDASDLDDTAERRRVSYRSSDPDFGRNMMVVTSFRKSKHRDPSYRQPSFTMEDVDVNNKTNFLTFDSSEFRLVPRGATKPMSRVEEGLGGGNDKIRTSPVPVNKGSRRTSMTRTLSKAKEFEDILGTVTDRNAIHDVDPFLSGDDEDDTNLYDTNRVATKRRSKALRRKKRDMDWDPIDSKAKASLAAYDGHEGNLFPELSQRDAAKFRNSGNAWLEGRYSTTVDWKRNATGMTLELPPIKIKQQTVPTPQLESKQIISESVSLNSGKTKARIELSVGPATEETTRQSFKAMVCST